MTTANASAKSKEVSWLSETTEPIFKEEIERIYKELDRHLFA